MSVLTYLVYVFIYCVYLKLKCTTAVYTGISTRYHTVQVCFTYVGVCVCLSVCLSVFLWFFCVGFACVGGEYHAKCVIMQLQC